MKDFITVVQKGTPAERALRRIAQDKLRPGTIALVSQEEFLSLRDDVDYIQITRDAAKACKCGKTIQNNK